jgi:hypothetical protein
MQKKMLLALTLAWPLAALPDGRFTFNPGTDKVEVRLDGKAMATFYYGREWPKPFLHGLRAPSGTVVTRGFPIEKIPGETSDHAWQRGLWFTHGDIAGVDYWRELGGDNTGVSKFPLPLGLLVVKGAPRLRTGRNGAVLTAEMELVPVKEKKPTGTMTQSFAFSRGGNANIIDVHVTVAADRGIALKFGDTEEGCLGFRFREEFRQDRGATLMNSDGLVTTEKIWGKRAQWVDYSTAIGAEKVGVTIMDHPKNPRHPTFWHARGYGMCAANPFGEHDFFDDRTRDGSVTVPKGGRIDFRYRVVIHGGDARDAGVKQLGAAYAAGK